LHGEVIHALTVAKATEQQTEQKFKNLDKRQEVSFCLNEEFTTKLSRASQIIIVDDVITSGATYKFIYNLLTQALGAHHQIELWAGFTRDHYR
jgi:predicted amidophosphoribosyltransferase